MVSYSLSAAAIGMAATLVDPVAAFWRMSCPGRLILERIDPIVNPGQVSGHVHTVSGGSGFDFTTSFAQQRASACSSCPIKADLSAYWTPKLYWRNKDNTQFIDVPQAGDYGGNFGGQTVYYQQRYSNSTKKVLAFPPDFRMIAGNPFKRSYDPVNEAPGAAVSFTCLNYAGKSVETKAMPNNKCPDGLRAQVYFPSCWDGVNTDSPDHKSHVAYPINGSYDNGQCPSSHPVRLISIFFEVVYSTANFDNMWWSNTQHPFVFAMGDTTGYAFHGDFLNGWDVDVLQRAADQCTNDSGNISDCPVFNNGLFTDDQCHACRLPPAINEQITGNLTALPGCNPVTSGPADAPFPVPGSCLNKATVGAPMTYYTDVTASKRWSYAGCAPDSIQSRTFTGADTNKKTMTVESCIDFCKAKGFSLAGLEYASECYCANSYSSPSRKPSPNILGQCTMPCAGNSTEICGGPGALSVYQACGATGSCANAAFAGSSAAQPASGGASSSSSSSSSSTLPAYQGTSTTTSKSTTITTTTRTTTRVASTTKSTTTAKTTTRARRARRS